MQVYLRPVDYYYSIARIRELFHLYNNTKLTFEINFETSCSFYTHKNCILKLMKTIYCNDHCNMINISVSSISFVRLTSAQKFSFFLYHGPINYKKSLKIKRRAGALSFSLGRAGVYLATNSASPFYSSRSSTLERYISEAF